MSEEPDDGTDCEPSDPSPTGSDEEHADPTESDTNSAPSASEGPGSHDSEDGDDTPVDESESADGDDNRDDGNESADDEPADGETDDSPEFTNVDRLDPDTDAESEPASNEDEDPDQDRDDVDDSADSDDSPLFEDYDPNEVPEDEASANGTAASSTGSSTESPDASVDDGLLGTGPESDEELPLAAHIEEMMKRLAVVFIVGGAVALTLLGLGQLSPRVPTAVNLIDILWNNAIPGAPEIAGRRPRVYSPLELLLTELKVTALAGLLVALPVFVYETYLFMRPGLYPTERRYYISAIPTSLVLGTMGMAFSHYIIIPAIMSYFTLYTDENIATVAYGLSDTFSLILVLMGYMAIIFQIPLFIMLAIMMGLVTRVWLEDKRLLFWGGFLTIAFLINPDPTGMTPFIIAATMIVLYEGTLALLRWTGN